MHNIAIYSPDNFSQQVMNFFLRANKYAFIPGILLALFSIPGAYMMFPEFLHKVIFLTISWGIFAFGCWLFSGYRYHAQKPAITKQRLLLWLGTILFNGLLAFTIAYLFNTLPLLLPIVMWTVSVSFLAICACINDLYTLWQAKQSTEHASRCT